MQEQMKEEEIVLGVGHGYLNFAEAIISGVKQMRKEINTITGRDFPRVHILDHDSESEGKIVWLKPNEFIIRFKGLEKFRCEYDEIQSNTIVTEIIEILKNAIMDDIEQLSETY